MLRVKRVIKNAVLLIFLLFLLTALPVDAREIVDMTGRKVNVPDKIKRVYSTSPPATYMVYALDPSLLAGLNSPLKEVEKKYLSAGIHSLPILGGYFGQGQVANIELIMKVKPDVVIMWTGKESAVNRKMEADMTNLGLPLVFMNINRIEDYGRGLKFLGKLLKQEARAQKLADYGEKALREVAFVTRSIRPVKRLSVYYAEGMDGLYTECDTSRHAELINLAGARNVIRCQTRNDYGMERVSLEKVLLANPEVIFVQEREAYDRIRHNPQWRQIKAVKDGQVYIIPKAPFNWFDRPPSYMRYLGIKWVLSCLYPDLYHIDMVSETKVFYRLFLELELNDAQVREIMAG
jgi:iron complex transport system substrate-binding protein